VRLTVCIMRSVRQRLRKSAHFLLLAVFGLFKGAFLSYCGALAKINFGLDHAIEYGRTLTSCDIRGNTKRGTGRRFFPLAARSFREHGGDTSGIGTVMKKAGPDKRRLLPPLSQARMTSSLKR